MRGRELRPHGFGVDVLQGAFTLWNRQDDGVLTAELRRSAPALPFARCAAVESSAVTATGGQAAR
jgi:hypothetical protein